MSVSLTRIESLVRKVFPSYVAYIRDEDHVEISDGNLLESRMNTSFNEMCMLRFITKFPCLLKVLTKKSTLGTPDCYETLNFKYLANEHFLLALLPGDYVLVKHIHERDTVYPFHTSLIDTDFEARYRLLMCMVNLGEDKVSSLLSLSNTTKLDDIPPLINDDVENEDVPSLVDTYEDLPPLEEPDYNSKRLCRYLDDNDDTSDSDSSDSDTSDSDTSDDETVFERSQPIDGNDRRKDREDEREKEDEKEKERKSVEIRTVCHSVDIKDKMRYSNFLRVEDDNLCYEFVSYKYVDNVLTTIVGKLSNGKTFTIQIKDDVFHGHYITCYPSGKPEYNANYVNGKLCGPMTMSEEDGSIHIECDYNDSPIKRVYNSKKKLVSETKLNGDHYPVTVTYFHIDVEGRVPHRTIYYYNNVDASNNVIDDKDVEQDSYTFNKKGQRMQLQRFYLSGKMKETNWDENNNLMSEFDMVDDHIKHGRQIIYLDDLCVLYQFYNMGELDREEKWDSETEICLEETVYIDGKKYVRVLASAE